MVKLKFIFTITLKLTICSYINGVGAEFVVWAKVMFQHLTVLTSQNISDTVLR